MENFNSDLAKEIVKNLAKDHALNITIITASPVNKSTGANNNPQPDETSAETYN